MPPDCARRIAVVKAADAETEGWTGRSSICRLRQHGPARHAGKLRRHAGVGGSLRGASFLVRGLPAREERLPGRRKLRGKERRHREAELQVTQVGPRGPLHGAPEGDAPAAGFLVDRDGQRRSLPAPGRGQRPEPSRSASSFADARPSGNTMTGTTLPRARHVRSAIVLGAPPPRTMRTTFADHLPRIAPVARRTRRPRKPAGRRGAR